MPERVTCHRFNPGAARTRCLAKCAGPCLRHGGSRNTNQTQPTKSASSSRGSSFVPLSSHLVISDMKAPTKYCTSDGALLAQITRVLSDECELVSVCPTHGVPQAGKNPRQSS